MYNPQYLEFCGNCASMLFDRHKNLLGIEDQAPGEHLNVPDNIEDSQVRAFMEACYEDASDAVDGFMATQTAINGEKHCFLTVCTTFDEIYSEDWLRLLPFNEEIDHFCHNLFVKHVLFYAIRSRIVDLADIFGVLHADSDLSELPPTILTH